MASEHVNAYPTPDQHDRWADAADDLGYDGVNSGFIRDMVEAGIKKIAPTVEPDETNEELREQRNDLRQELRQSRERVERLEDALHGERAAITSFVKDNPGTTEEEIHQHIVEDTPFRVDRHLDILEGSELTFRNGGYYPAGEGE